MQLTVQYIMKTEEQKEWDKLLSLADRFENTIAKCKNCIYYHPKFQLCYISKVDKHFVIDEENEWCNCFKNKEKEWIE